MPERAKPQVDRKNKSEKFSWKPPGTPLWKDLLLEHRLPWRYKIRIFPWKPNKKIIILDITYACNLGCYNCHRSCGNAPSGEYMSLEQIKKFINESIELKWVWNWIKILGGEPTLHLHFFDIIKELKRYKDLNPDCKVELFTNGAGKKTNEVLSKMPDWIKVDNTVKRTVCQDFVSYNIAPVDLPEYEGENFAIGCAGCWRWGISLSKYGYFSCGPGAGVARVFGFDVGIKTLAEVKRSSFRKQMKILCKYCGMYKENYVSKRISTPEISASWQEAYKRYKKQKPNMSQY